MHQTTQYVPIVEELETLVIFNQQQGWMRLGSSFYCRGDELVESLIQCLKLNKQKYVEIRQGTKVFQRTTCPKDVTTALLLSVEQHTLSVALKHAQGASEWRTLTHAARMIRGKEIIGYMSDRARHRFELHALTIPTLFSQTGDLDYMKSLVEVGEQLVRFTSVDHTSPAGSREAGFLREAGGGLRLVSADSIGSTARMGSGETMPARVWRIIRHDQSVPAGYERAHRSVDNDLRIDGSS